MNNNQDRLFFAVDGIQIRFIIKRHIWQFKDNFRRIKNETQTLKNGPMWAWQKTLQSTLTAADILIPSKHQVGYI